MRRQGTYPLDNPLALRQLAAWTVIADTWPVTFAWRHNQLHLICHQCSVTILNLSGANSTGFYVFTQDIVTSATVAHLRNLHRDLDPDDGGTDDRQDTETTDIARDTSASSLGNPDTD